MTGQLDMFPETPRQEIVDPDEVRAELVEILAIARTARDAAPLDRRTQRYHRVVFPRVARWLPKDEAAQLCFKFARETGPDRIVAGGIKVSEVGPARDCPRLSDRRDALPRRSTVCARPPKHIPSLIARRARENRRPVGRRGRVGGFLGHRAIPFAAFLRRFHWSDGIVDGVELA